MRVPALVLIGLVALVASPRAGQTPRNSGAPETFSVNAQAKGAAGAVAATILIDIQRTRWTSIARRSNRRSRAAAIRRS